MQWHDYPLAWKEYANMYGIKGEPAECVRLMRRRLGEDKALWNTHNQMVAELNWTKNRRPYYDLYPGIAQAFAKVDLSRIKCEHLILPLPELLIRLPVGHELQGSKRAVHSILVSDGYSEEHQTHAWLLSINDGTLYEGYKVHTVNAFSLLPEESVLDRLTYGRQNPYCDDEIDNEEVDMAVRIVVAICLLSKDETLVESLPLSADVDKWEKTHDPALLDKAARRGKRGWAVGKHIELVPHFRRPHFAIRWCVPGGNDPRLRPIKGSIVLRDQAKKMPTGYLEEVAS